MLNIKTFDQIEPNNLKGLQAGHVIAQLPVKPECTLLESVGSAKFLANGHIMTIAATDASEDGTAEKVELDIWAEGKPMFIHFSEELPTIINEKNTFAVNVAEECPRLVELFPGDEWMSTIDYLNDDKYTSIKETLKGHIKQIKMPTDDWYAVDSMADGTKAFHYIYLG